MCEVFSDAQWLRARSITDKATPTVANAIEMSLVPAEVARLLLELQRDDEDVARAAGILQVRHHLSGDEAHRQLQEAGDAAAITLEEVAQQVTGSIQ